MTFALERPKARHRGAHDPAGQAVLRTVSEAVSTSTPRIGSVCSDAELIQRTGAGDRAAFETLYKRYSRPVFALALRRLGDRGRAEDALQETFVSIWRSAGTYKPERGPGAPWLYGVARNAIVDRSRARHEPPADAPEEASLDAGPEERAERSWVQWRVHRALETLPEREREVIALAYWSDLSQSEVAAKLGIPLGTVKTRTLLAMRKLREALRDEMRDLL